LEREKCPREWFITSRSGADATTKQLRAVSKPVIMHIQYFFMITKPQASGL
jgi:hypothetical protein